MTATDKIRAHAFGVDTGVCPNCETMKAMEDFHEIQRERLRGELQRREQREDALAVDLLQAKTSRNNWKLAAFAGWALVVMLAIGDIFRWGRA